MSLHHQQFKKKIITSTRLCIGNDEVHALALQKINGEKCSLDLATLGNAYLNLLNEEHPKREFWQTPGFVIGEFAVSVGIGATFGLTHCFGLCP